MNIQFFLPNMKPNHVVYLSFKGSVINLTLKETVAVWPQDKGEQHVTPTFFLIYGALTQILQSSLGDVICSCNQLEMAGTISSNISYTFSYHNLAVSQTGIEDIQSFLT